MKKILLIGANSALAKAVAPVLAESNTVVTAGRSGCDVYCDITESFTLPEDYDVVINFAAVFGGDSDEDFAAALKTNIQGALNVCMAAKAAAHTPHVINVSSIFALLDENSPQYSTYSITKKQADELTSYYCRVNAIPLTVLRPSQIYGDSDDFAKHQPFLYHIVDKAEQGQDVQLYGSNDARRNYIHCADVAEIMKRVVEQGLTGTYTCMNPNDVSYSQVARAAQAVFGKGGKVVFLPDKPNVPDNVFAKDLAIYKSTGYTAAVSIEEGMRRIKKFREGKL